ncbi:hypothetical protein F4804DRAFT_330629 [Jackrogersella minutella]|nr:hypothetical protein F4804DRAFT_330629 [Jackrogersella minutella]
MTASNAKEVSFDITPEKEASKLQFLLRQFSGAPPVVLRRDVDLSGKTAIVTGANGGIGLEFSRQLLDFGVSKLILAVRDEIKGEAARTTLTTAKTLEPNQEVERAEGLSPRLDFAILNAGVNCGCFALNPNTGHEEDLQAKYLSTVLLALLLLRLFKKIKSTAGPSEYSPGCIVIVSFDTAAWAKFDEKSEGSLL